MFLEWWMILIVGVVWLVSVISHGSFSFNQGSIVMLAKLQQSGYISINEEGEVIGLCNRDQENWRDLNQDSDKEEE